MWQVIYNNSSSNIKPNNQQTNKKYNLNPIEWNRLEANQFKFRLFVRYAMQQINLQPVVAKIGSIMQMRIVLCCSSATILVVITFI